MQVSNTLLTDVLLLEPDVFGDNCGFFMETYNANRYAEAGIAEPFVQDNLSYSSYGVLRGLHLQNPNSQGKLVYVLQGSVFDVAVDVRVGSPQFGQWFGTLLSDENKRQLYVPGGFAHGFCVTSETALFAYKCTDVYNAAAELSIAWDDPQIGINWPVESPSLSEKDAAARRLAELDQQVLPVILGRGG